MALTVESLEKLAAQGCQTPGCKMKHEKSGVLAPRCHRGRGVDVEYIVGEGKLVIRCAVCRQLVCEVAVKSDPSMCDPPMCDSCKTEKGTTDAQRSGDGKWVKICDKCSLIADQGPLQ